MSGGKLFLRDYGRCVTLSSLFSPYYHTSDMTKRSFDLKKDPKLQKTFMFVKTAHVATSSPPMSFVRWLRMRAWRCKNATISGGSMLIEARRKRDIVYGYMQFLLRDSR